jgi:hypothetical protein
MMRSRHSLGKKPVSAGRVGAKRRIEAKRVMQRAAHLVSMTLLKNVALWDGSPPGRAGVPNLFGLSPPGRHFMDAKPPNKLGTPTDEHFSTEPSIRYATQPALALWVLHTTVCFLNRSGFCDACPELVEGKQSPTWWREIASLRSQ